MGTEAERQDTWFCGECTQKILNKRRPAPPQRKVLFLDDTGRLQRLPFCSVCRDRLAVFGVGGLWTCRHCRDWPDGLEPELDTGVPDKPKRPGLGASVIDFPSEYVCVDVETTGRDPAEDEIIEIAALHVKDGAVCGVFSSLVRPKYSHVPWTQKEIEALGYSSVDDVPRAVFEDGSNRPKLPAAIVKLTGITDDMLRDAPGAEEVIPQFHEFAGDHVLAGHYVIFDLYFLYDACREHGLLLKNDYIDTLRIARNLLPELPHHDLSSLVSRFGIVQETAHRAEADARAAAECLEAMKALVLQTQTVSEYVSGFVDSARKPSARTRKKIYEEKRLRPAGLAAPEDPDPTHPLYGKTVVFTGELHMPRAGAAQMAADVGAVVKTAVSGKTDFLVVGQQDVNLVGSSGISGKERKAREINASGKGNIQILSEQDFIRLTGPEKAAGAV